VCEIFCTSPDRPWCSPSLLYSVCRVSFPGVKRPGRGVDHPSLFSVDVKKRVELYLYPPSGPLWSLLGWTLTLPLISFGNFGFISLFIFFAYTVVCLAIVFSIFMMVDVGVVGGGGGGGGCLLPVI